MPNASRARLLGLSVRRGLTLIKWMQFQTCFAKWLEEDLQSPRAIVHIGRLSLQQSVELINNNSTRVQDMLATNELWPIDEKNEKETYISSSSVRTHAFWWNSTESTKTGLDLLKISLMSVMMQMVKNRQTTLERDFDAESLLLQAVHRPPWPFLGWW